MASPIIPPLRVSRQVGLLRLNSHLQTVFKLECIFLYPLNSIRIMLRFAWSTVHSPFEDSQEEHRH